jgi:hypothetical protein
MEATRDPGRDPGAGRDPDAAYRAGVREGAARGLAQTVCLGTGLVLIAVGILGFIFADPNGSEFSSNPPNASDFIVFPVNAWHNIVHIATGVFLVLMAGKAASAVLGLLIFGVVYAVVTVWGFVDGDDILRIVPVDTADNFLHLALAALSLLVAFMAGGLKAAGRKAAPGS